MPAITFQSVDNEYEWGTYFDFKVLIMSRNGYINATKMCQDEGKRIKDWLKNKSSIELINKFASRSALKIADIIIIVKDGDNDNRGTYIHRKLITHFASWISPDIALKVSDIIEEYLLKEEKMKHAVVVKEKDNEIDELKGMVKAILKNTNNLNTKVTDLTDEISKLSLDNQITHEKLDNAQITLNDSQNTLNIIVEDRVVKPSNKGMTNTVLIYEYDMNKFRIFRIQKRSVKTVIRRYLTENPNAVKFAEIEYNPNSINYFIRFKEQLKGNIKWHYNKFELSDITKNQLKEFIDEINNEKYQIENYK